MAGFMQDQGLGDQQELDRSRESSKLTQARNVRFWACEVGAC